MDVVSRQEFPGGALDSSRSITDGEVGIGVIGYGIGRVHSHAWSNIPLFFKDAKAKPTLVGICGRNSSKAGELARVFGYESTYSNWRDLVRDPRVRIVDNCAPPNVHLEPSLAAFESGKAVICEKPLARNAGEAYEIYRAAQRSGSVGMTGFTIRFAPAVLLAKKLIESGRLGKVYNMRCSYHNIETGNGGFLDPNYPMNWHLDKEVAGSGAISDLGSHALDMVRFLLGNVSEVCGVSETFVKERPLPEDAARKGKVTVDDATLACLKLESGALATVDVSWMAAGRKDYFYFEVNGGEGSVRFNFERLDELEVYLRDGSEVEGFRDVFITSKKHPYVDRFWVDQGAGFGWNHLFVLELRHFLDCVVEGRDVGPVGPSLRDGYVNSLLIDSILESAESGRWVRVEAKD